MDNSIVQFLNEKESIGWIRMKNPIPMINHRQYFEAMILHSHDDICAMEFGLTSKDVTKMTGDTKTELNDLPEMCKDGAGFRKYPYAFGYSSNGEIYGSDILESSYDNQKYYVGDRVGCYLDKENGICCFTKNGIVQNPIIHLTKLEHELFPTILFHSNGIMINSYFDERMFKLEIKGKRRKGNYVLESFLTDNYILIMFLR